MRSLAVSKYLPGSRKDCAFSRMRSERKYTYFGKLKTNLGFVFMQQLRRLAWALPLRNFVLQIGGVLELF